MTFLCYKPILLNFILKIYILIKARTSVTLIVYNLIPNRVCNSFSKTNGYKF